MCATSSTTQSWSWPPDAPPPSDQGGEDKPGRVDPDTLPKNVPEHSTEVVIIARFRAREGNEEAVAAALRAQCPRRATSPVVWRWELMPPRVILGCFSFTRSGATRRHL